MITTESRDAIQIGGKKVSMHGKFKLTCKKPANKFTLTNINAHAPYGKGMAEMDHFYDQTGKRPFLFIDKIITVYDPDNNDIDAKNVAALIRNENVRLEDMTDAEHDLLVQKGLKKPNPEFTLLNVDKAIVDKHEEDVEMIEIKYLITKKKDALSKKKLMYITSALGLPTKSMIEDEVRYMAHLQGQLMRFLESNKDRRADFLFYYEKIEETEIVYYINQFIELGFVQDFGGIFKVEDKPVGFKKSDVKDYFAANEDDYAKFKFKVDEYNSNLVTK